jgi:hypothetical protein
VQADPRRVRYRLVNLSRVAAPEARRRLTVHSSRCGAAFATAAGKEAQMTIRVTADKRAGMTKIQFVLPDDVHDGPVSAVGDFNEWRPGEHKLVRRSNGTRSVTVSVPAGQELQFRYLGSGGVWFDDPEAIRAGYVRT